MKLLLVDIETAPNLGAVWGLFNQNISPKHILEVGYTLCWSAKWLGQKQIKFDSVYQPEEGMTGKEKMVEGIWDLLDKADAVIHYNGTRFDVPTLNKEFLEQGLLPPSPYKQIDLIRTVRQRFRFHSNKLDEVLKRLGLETKIEHKGMELWLGCMNGDPKCWREMKRYNKRDVKIMEDFYLKLLPWITTHPNYGLYIDSDRPICNKCGSTHLQKRGLQPTTTQVYQRYQCMGCGSWCRDRTNSTTASMKKNVVVGIS